MAGSRMFRWKHLVRGRSKAIMRDPHRRRLQEMVVPCRQAARNPVVPGWQIRSRRFVAFLLLMFAVTAGWAGTQPPRRVERLEGPWRFLREDLPAASAENFDDSAWTVVTLPHTWNAADG